MGITLLILGAFGLLDTFLIFQDGALGATPPQDKWVYIAAVAALIIYVFNTDQDEWTEHLGFGAAMLGVAIDIIPRIFKGIFPHSGGFSFSAFLLLLLLPVLVNLFLFLKKKSFSQIFIQFEKGHESALFTSLWFVYTCGALLLFSAMHYSLPGNDCQTFILNIFSDMDTPITLANIPQWPLAVKIILGITVFSFIVGTLSTILSKKTSSKLLAVFEELAVTIDLLYILKIYFFLTEHFFGWADFLIWIVLDIFIVLTPIVTFFPSTFKAYKDITEGIASTMSNAVEPNDRIKKRLDTEERIWNEFIEDKGAYTDEELRLMGKENVHRSIDKELLRAERRKKLEKEYGDD
ncbi:MAG: hypothetical protein IJ285_02665 [Clostridia bacterium]|nr:hypothetical protein [Clostridia bacterium]